MSEVPLFHKYSAACVCQDPSECDQIIVFGPLVRTALSSRHFVLFLYLWLIDSGLAERPSLGEVSREQKMLKGHLPRVIDHQVY